MIYVMQRVFWMLFEMYSWSDVCVDESLGMIKSSMEIQLSIFVKLYIVDLLG